jgi:hypothetical protein
MEERKMFLDSSVQFQDKRKRRRKRIYRQGAKVAKGRRGEALNLKFEIRKEEVEPRMDAKEREGEERDWVLEISDWGERRNRRNFEF